MLLDNGGSIMKNTKPTKAKAAKVQHKGVISVCKNTEGSTHVYVQADDGRSFTRDRRGDTKEFRKLSAVGQQFNAALKWHNANPPAKPIARLAKGVDSHNSPHSAAAVAAQKGKPAATGKGKPRAEKASKAKQPSRGVARKYTLAGRKDESKPGTFRTYMLSTIMGHKDTESAKAAHAKSGKYPDHKLDFNWAAQQGYIKFTD
jgi:hypothetical protein